MAHTLVHDEELGCIVLTFTGRVTMDVIREVAPEVGRLSKDTGCRRILNDMSAATVAVSISDIYQSPEAMQKAKVSRRTKRALVLPRSFPHADFLEDVTRNRGHYLQIFSDVEKAKVWLLAEE